MEIIYINNKKIENFWEVTAPLLIFISLLLAET